MQSGKIVRHVVNGNAYLSPAGIEKLQEPQREVRFLAPFDPLVWDRERFELLWDWNYRFEAYTPVSKRVRGYYAMPLLWCNNIIGWANVSVTEGSMNVELGFNGKRPKDSEFKMELQKEMERMKYFLRV
jgi:hypothetical protein